MNDARTNGVSGGARVRGHHLLSGNPKVEMRVGDRVRVIAPGCWNGVEGTIIERYWIDASAGYDWRVEVETIFYRPQTFERKGRTDYLSSALPFREEELEKIE
jgi:hypothetical protein